MTTAASLFAEAAELRARAEAAEAEARRLQAQERESAISAGLALYQGEPWTRAKALAVDLKAYAANGWRREPARDELPDNAPQKRRAWHRILHSRGGVLIGDRQIFNLSKLKSDPLAISAAGVRIPTTDAR